MASPDGQPGSGPPPRKKAAKPSLPHNIGGFFGHIIKAIKTDVTSQPPHATVRVTHDEQPVTTPIGPGTLRTTVRDELHADPHNPSAITARRITTEELRVPPQATPPPAPPPPPAQ
ncbi:MAG: hypothetical protein MUE97_03235 [Phycisphaerales bacterium]|jgi:hypothetical protein|nr:hypothetical protein [Phycisphaerales bacterium]